MILANKKVLISLGPSSGNCSFAIANFGRSVCTASALEFTHEQTRGEREEMAGCVPAMSGSWKSLLLAAMESNSHLKHSTYFQLATVASSGRPSNRTVVFRGFEEGTDKIQINTDIRTTKIEEVRHCPFGEICWYFTDSWEQFRIGGRIEIIDGSNADPAKLMKREKSWFASSLKSRFQYLGPAPRLPIVGIEPDRENLDQSTGPVDTFCLLVFDPEQVDYLNLKSNERLMFTFKPSSDGCKHWMSEQINP